MSAPNHRFRLGLVGLNFGRHIVENQLMTGPGHPYFQLTTLCDLDREKADAMAAAHSLKVADSYAALLADPDIDVIGLYTGPVGRADLLRQAVDAGKPVMTTKPFELDSAKARDILAYAAKKGIPIHLNSPGPLRTPDQKVIQDWEEKFQIGKVVAARFETYAAYREKPDGRWLDDPKSCPVAPIFRLGIYAINELVRLVGQPEAVTVQHSRLFTERPTPDNAHMSIRFANGALGSVFASMCIDNGIHYPNTLTIHYQNGTIWRNTTWDDNSKDTQDTCELRVSTGAIADKVHEVVRLPKNVMAGAYQWDALHRVLSGETLPDAITADAIVAGLQVIEAMAASEATGAMVSVNLPK